MSRYNLSMKALYLEDSYLTAFEATIESVSSSRIILDETAFYPQSGGQPSDLGSLRRDREEFEVMHTELSDIGIVHVVDRAGLKTGDNVLGTINWERRYILMRSHTACHILGGVIFKETGAKITGNQIDMSKSRVDFSLESFDKAKMNHFVDRTNQIIADDRRVEIKVLPRVEALAIPNLVRLTIGVPDKEMIRVVEIEGVDLQACGGTHVKRTGEIKGIRLIKAENKGKSNRRVYFALEGEFCSRG